MTLIRERKKRKMERQLTKTTDKTERYMYRQVECLLFREKTLLKKKKNGRHKKRLIENNYIVLVIVCE